MDTVNMLPDDHMVASKTTWSGGCVIWCKCSLKFEGYTSDEVQAKWAYHVNHMVQKQIVREQMPNLHDKYPYIVKWGKYLGSMDYYIQGELERAVQTNAPQNAIYWDGSKWHTTEDIVSPTTRLAILGPETKE